MSQAVLRGESWETHETTDSVPLAYGLLENVFVVFTRLCICQFFFTFYIVSRGLDDITDAKTGW